MDRVKRVMLALIWGWSWAIIVTIGASISQEIVWDALESLGLHPTRGTLGILASIVGVSFAYTRYRTER